MVKVKAKAKMLMLMVIPLIHIDGEGKVEDAYVDGNPLLLIDGEGKVKDVDDEPLTPNRWRR